ncbi:unnamed protein product [Ostreobium quekettii]|uniref:Uncharacterized protein n=1 Tax=Ostreobium quekettii TaxID=121088 RepID=A0A8S1IYY7_9CHLO|nr:unnamed protein product [Ostreobium quekettii]
MQMQAQYYYLACGSVAKHRQWIGSGLIGGWVNHRPYSPQESFEATAYSNDHANLWRLAIMRLPQNRHIQATCSRTPLISGRQPSICCRTSLKRSSLKGFPRMPQLTAIGAALIAHNGH